MQIERRERKGLLSLQVCMVIEQISKRWPVLYFFPFKLINYAARMNLLLALTYGGLMVSALDSESRGLGSSPGRGHCAVFLSETLYSHSASLHPGV